MCGFDPLRTLGASQICHRMVSFGGVEKLTPRQKEISRLILNGLDAKLATRELGISLHTVNEYLSEARRHFGVSSSRDAARNLRQAESAPPNNMGPNSLGVVHPAGGRFWLRQLSPNRWLAHAGASLLVVIAAAAITLSIANGSLASKHPTLRRRSFRLGPVLQSRIQAPISLATSRSADLID